MSRQRMWPFYSSADGFVRPGQRSVISMQPLLQATATLVTF
jgi:hypothetical protein